MDTNIRQAKLKNMKFLDTDGVSILWNKIKGNFLSLKGGGYISATDYPTFVITGSKQGINIYNHFTTNYSAQLPYKQFIEICNVYRSNQNQSVIGSYTLLQSGSIILGRLSASQLGNSYLPNVNIMKDGISGTTAGMVSWNDILSTDTAISNSWLESTLV